MLNYSQGFAVSGYLGTCTEASEANLLTIAGQDVSEADVLKRAIANGWCNTTAKNPALRGGSHDRSAEGPAEKLWREHRGSQ